MTRAEQAETRDLRKRVRLLGAGERGAAPGRGVSVPGESAGKRLYPLVSELAADGIAVAVACRVLKLARQPYYRWLAESVTDAEWIQAHRANALFDAHREDPEFGYRYLLDEARDAGQVMVERTAWRICSDNGWWSAFGKKRGRNGKKPGPPVHDDLCAVTDESGPGPARVHGRRGERALDRRHHRTDWTGEGKLYVCAFKDVWSNRIVGYSIDSIG